MPQFLDNKTEINTINTNARSLRPKIKSFIQCFLNLSLTFAVITETWLALGSKLELESENLLMGHGLAIQYLNRLPSINGVSHGGVAVVMRDSTTKSHVFPFPNPDFFEVLPLVAAVATIKRKFYVVAAYIPPNYTVARGKACLQHISDLILEIKRKCPDPYILLAGDFNQWDIGGALVDYPDLQEISTPPTRGDRRIDKTFCNWHEEVHDAGCVPPLETEGCAETKTYSDHDIQYTSARIEKKTPINWTTYTYQPYTESGASKFAEELSARDWGEVYAQQGSNQMAIRFQQIVDDMMLRHFPPRTVKRRDSDLPWFDSVARKMSRKKLAIYRAEGKSERWTKQSEKLQARLDRRQQVYLAKQRDKLLGPAAVSNFFKNVRAYKSVDKPKDFDIRDLRPNNTDMETATEAAAYFNRISNEFQPLQPEEIPATYHRDLPLLSPANVQQMLIKAKKTNSMVKGDIFPKLINRCSEALAWPLSAIYNDVIINYVWPTHWKREFVTIIPKKATPTSFADLRNISCTLFFSKVLEQYVLTCLKEEISVKSNQYGGVKGCSTTHMVVDILQEICENGEDYRSATVMCAIDYAKAFNRMSYQHCLEAFRKKGASTPILRLLATFLTNRTMSVRVGSSWSDPLPVSGGCPQGSILGVALFNTATDMLEDKFQEFENSRLGIPNVVQEEQPQDNIPGERLPPTTSTPTANRAGDRPTIDDVPPICKPPSKHDQYKPKVTYKPIPQPTLIVPPAETRTGTQVLTKKGVKIAKYIDDNITIEKMNCGPVAVEVRGEERIKRKQAFGIQNAFRSITTVAKEMGMVVNEDKTHLLTVSDALNYRPEAYILDSEDRVIETSPNMRVLGFNLSDRPTVTAHVASVVKGMRMRYWSLMHLKNIGFNEEELVQTYQSSIRPLADYCCPAYHSMTTDIHDQLLEQAQTGALRRIYGYKVPAMQLRQRSELETLRERRVKLTDKFATKCITDERFKHWFPVADGRKSGRQSEKYKEFFAKCDRLKNSPLYYMRRRLNGKEGKKYGERNKKYRENFSL